MGKIYSCILCLFLIAANVKAQDVQLSLSPTQLLFFHNTEVVLSTKIKTWRIGLLGAYAPARQKDGAISSAGDGLFGSYGNPHFHKVFRLWSAGLYGQKDIGKNFFVATEIAFRNWNFKKKQVSYNNVEGYSFDALRSDNIDVWITKFFVGLACFPQNRFYMDIRVGFGVRQQQKTYLTHNKSNSNQIVLTEKEQYLWGTPQMDIRLGYLLFENSNKTD